MNTLFKLFHTNFIHKTCKRYLSLQLERLNQRAILKLRGQDVLPFLQGLITNDVNHLNDNGRALFTHFLNPKGRTQYDALLYRFSEEEILLDCDISIADDLTKHMKMFRVRKNVEVESSTDIVWNIFNDFDVPFFSKKSTCNDFTLLSEFESCFNKIESTLRDKKVIAFRDPRVTALGVRVITSEVPVPPIKFLSDFNIDHVESNSYSILRYKLGIPEGATELPVGKCFPLETNCDYLHGVSFHKGCYIGQELTARTHHTGVVRKRIMPIILSSVPDKEFKQDEIIVTDEDKVIGKFRGQCKNYAIGLLRVSETSEYVSNLKLNGISAFTYRPYWWPHKSKEDFTKN